MLAATPVRPSLTRPYELNEEKRRVRFNVLPQVPPEFYAISHKLNAVTNPASSIRPAMASLPIVPLPVRRPLEADIKRITFDIPSLAPMGFTRFCMQYPQDCRAPKLSYRPELVSLTQTRKVELVMVNGDVNRSIKPRQKAIDVSADEWLLSPREGNCKDYAITKRHELLALGWPAASLLLAEVVVSSGEHHLVLVVRTRENHLVLDNLNENIRPISQIPYRWVRAEEPRNPRFWATINSSGAMRTAMNAR